MKRTEDFADEYGENILHSGGHGGDVTAGSKVLCPNMTAHIQEVSIAVHKLPFAQKLAITHWYTADIGEDGRVPTLAQIAMKSRVSLAVFEQCLEEGERQVLVLLTDC